MKVFFLKFEIFNETHHPTRYIKYKNIDFVPCNKSTGQIGFVNQFGTISKTDLISAFALIARNISSVNFSKLAKMAIV